ncbi:radical SAM protein [Geomonas sp. Red32]|uniref:B12-binding domain-containing radical SAM protein n=1 Tax=Geomonas sp. Red32 TaxID=2912856 RepID=UPI00202CFCFB|nr:radical SAM protein [Geomonas sp. Red32]MCM0082753.1 radical SAM protein [Geomonas sp. Red32]
MNILLAYQSHPEGADDPFTSLLPAGLLTLDAAARKAGHRSTLANLSGVPRREVKSLLQRLRPELVGLSQFTHNRVETLAIARIAKELNPATVVVLGGPHATHAWPDLLARHPEIDAVAIGEGEETLVELLGRLSAGGTLAEVAGLACRVDGTPAATPHRAPVAELDLLPLAGESTGESFGVDYRRQLEFVITSRGCPASCLFCSSPLFWGRGVRFRSPASVVAELKMLIERYGLLYFSFRDDTFTSDRKRVLEICRLIREERLPVLWNCQSRVNAVDEEMLRAMKLAGCECIQFGVESGAPEMLKALGKRIRPHEVETAAEAVRKVGINLSVYLITGIPGENEGHLKESLRLIETIKPHDGQVSPLVYYPGTRLFDGAVREGTVPADLFERPSGEGFLVRRDPFVEKSRTRLLKTLERVGARGAYTLEDFERQRKLLGWSLVTEMLCGESLEGEGAWDEAAAVYRSIARREPENPWGHLLLGGLLARTGDLAKASECYRKVAKLVPRHLPAFLSLGELALEGGDRRGAEKHFKEALKLDPQHTVALEGMEACR